MKNVLLVTSAIESFLQTARFLQSKGMQTHLCKDAASAMATAEQVRPDLVVFDDLQLGTHTGPRLRRQANVASPAVIACVDKAAINGIEVGFHMPIQAVVPKPVDPMTLYDVAKALVRQSADARPAPAKAAKAASKDTQPIRSLTMGRLAYHSHMAKTTGLLEVTKDDRRMTVTIDRGVIVQVHSNFLGDDSLGMMLVRHGVMTQREYEIAFDAAKSQDKRLGDVLIEMGILDDVDLSYELRRQKLAKLQQLLGEDSWWGGRVSWQDKERVDPGDYPLGIPMVKIIKRAILRQMPPDLPLGIFRKKQLEHTPIAANADLPKVIKNLELPNTMVELAHALAGNSIMELSAQGLAQEDGHVAVRLAFLLALCKGVRIGGDDNAARDVDRTERREPSRLTSMVTVERISKAERHFQAKEYKKSLEVVERILSDEPDCNVVWGLYGILIYETRTTDNQEQLDRAKQLLTESLHLSSDDARVHYYLGLVYKTELKDSLAARHFEAAMRLDPQHQGARHELDLISVRQRVRDTKRGYRS
ncbi:hypothetical protein KDL45_00380 [bacterium]|nr:hypothetical protein [bacterium]MCB9479915.1 hypothetical protein [Deltaproteobacteria bacterium]